MRFTFDTDDVWRFIKRNPQPLVAAASTGTGATAGGVIVAASGFTAAGMVGGGAGIGSAAGPVGVAVGALTGLAVYGAYRAAASIRWSAPDASDSDDSAQTAKEC